MFYLTELRWILLASVFTLLSVAVSMDVEAAIEITIAPPSQTILSTTEPATAVPKPRTRSISATLTPDIKKLIVNGYKNNIFVHGELKALPNGLIEGYVYSGSKPTYIYGEFRRNEQVIQAYDSEGQLYLLELIKK